MTEAIVAVSLGMILGRLPSRPLDRTGVALLGAIASLVVLAMGRLRDRAAAAASLSAPAR